MKGAYEVIGTADRLFFTSGRRSIRPPIANCQSEAAGYRLCVPRLRPVRPNQTGTDGYRSERVPGMGRLAAVW